MVSKLQLSHEETKLVLMLVTAGNSHQITGDLQT